MTLRCAGAAQSARIGAPAPLPGELPVSLLCFVSGASSLIFEILWFYRCGLAFGNSIWATSIVLSSFMGGLALGTAWVARYGHRVGRFLRTYAALELVVAVAGVTLTVTLPDLISLLTPLTRRVIDIPWLVNLLRLITAFAALAVPTTAMGATLPLLVGALCRQRDGFGRALGRLYGWNTLGAITGSLGAEVILIDRFGVDGSAWIAGSLNLGAAAAALWIARHVGDRQEVVNGAPPPRALHSWRLLACAFLAGGNLMALEVIWFRFSSMFVENSTLAFSLMLAVVLAGMAIGAFTASSWLNRRPHAASYLAAAAFTAAWVSAGSYIAFQLVTGGPRASEWYRILWFASVLTFPTSLLSGLIFTLLGEAVKRDMIVDARAAGWLTLANTTGAMCGPLLATFVLLPALGMERAFFALAATYGAIGLLAMTGPLRRPSLAPGRVLVVMALVAVVVLARFPFGLMAKKFFNHSVEGYRLIGDEIVATREGPTETIFLMQLAWMGNPIYHRLVTNGFSMSTTHTSGKRYMRYFVYWPMLLHKAPLRRVLVVCYGLGVTAGAATDLDSVESIDVVDISRDVVAMSDIIYPPDQHPLHDRRVRVHVEDGRYLLQATGQRFDLITGEPPPPFTPGTVSLYTREYFQLIHDRLAEGGMTTYWLPVARAGEYDVKPIVRAFCDVFEDCSLWQGAVFDWMLVGTRHAPGPVSEVQFSTPWSHPIVAPHLREIGFELPQQIGATFLGDAVYLRSLAAGTAPLTDEYPQRLAPLATRLSGGDRTRFDRGATDFIRSVIDPQRARQAFAASEFIRRLWPETLVKQTLPFFAHQRVINRLMSEAVNPLQHIEELHALLTETPLQRLPLWELGSDDARQRIADTGNDGTGMVEYVLGVRALVDRNYPSAASYFAESERRGLRQATIRPLLVYALCLAGNLDTASELSQGVKPHDADELHFWIWLGSKFGVGPKGAGPKEETR